MSGHYHIECEPGDDVELVDDDGDPADDDFLYVNEPDLDKAIALARVQDSVGNRPIRACFICTYGCGQHHPLTPSEAERLEGEFPGIEVVRKS